MIRKLLIAALFASFAFTAAGEGGRGLVELGIKAGVTTPNIKFVKGDRGDFNLSTDPKTGFHAGLASRINLPVFHVQPEILYSHTSYNLTAVPQMGAASATKVKINNVDVPVLVGLRLLWFRLQAGPMFTVMTETSTSGGADVSDVVINKSTVSYLLGVGFDIGKLNLDVRYNGMLSRSDQYVGFGSSDGADYKSKFKSWMFSIGYMF